LTDNKDSFSDQKKNVLDVLGKWIEKNINYGSIKPEIFVKRGVPYAFTLRRGDEIIHHEIGDEI